MKYYAKVKNVYFASKFFGNKFGKDFEGEVTVSTCKLMARMYDSVDVLKRDAQLLGVGIDQIELVEITKKAS